MSDDDRKTVPEPAATQEEPKTIMGVAPEVFMRGGTKSSAHDKLMQEQRAGDEARRAVADKERQIAQIPIEEGGGVQFTNKLTDNPEAETAKVLLTYRGFKGRIVTCLGDVTMLQTGELELILVCPQCIAQGVPHGRAQLNIKQSNKRWELDQRTAGEPIEFDGNVYRSAGRIRECPLSKCPDCGWAFRIDDNVVWPES